MFFFRFLFFVFDCFVSPIVVANLWDVTDKDCDRFAIGLLEESIFFYKKAFATASIATATLTENGGKNRNSKYSSRHSKYKNNVKNSKEFDIKHCKDVLKSVSDAVAISRNQCRLKYLNGAAPVCYGIPFHVIHGTQV